MFCKVFVDIPSIDSLEEYSPLLTGDNHTAPTSVATKMAQMENEIRALKRAHEALRQYVISILPPQQPAADSLTRPPTESLPNIGADTFPHPRADALAQPEPQTNGLGQAPTDASTSTRQDEVAELMPTHVEVALANVEVDIGPTDVEMVPAGDVDRQPGGQNAGVAAEEFRAGCERRPADVDGDGGQADAGVSTLAAAGGAHLRSLEDGEIPQDQHGLFKCTPPQVADLPH